MVGRVRCHRLTGALVLLTCAWMSMMTPVSGAGERPEARADLLLRRSGVRGGLVVHLGCGKGRLTAALHRGQSYVVHGLDTDAAEVARARAYLSEQGLYGDVTVEKWDGGRLPHADGLADLLIVEKPGGVPESEMMRVLSPGGVLCRRKGGEWITTKKPWPDEIDEWSHYLHGPDNNAVAQDERIGPLRRMQWKCGPAWSRSHEFSSSLAAMVSAAGRLFYVFDYGVTSRTGSDFPTRWTLVARDAFNGALLWKRRLENWDQQGWKNTALRAIPGSARRRLVAGDSRVYITPHYRGGPVEALEAATGEAKQTYEETRGCREIRLADGVLVARVSSGRRTSQLVAVDVETGDVRWKTDSRRIQRNQFAIHAGRVVYPTGGKQQTLECLRLSDGESAWQTSLSLNLRTLAAHADRVVALGGGSVSVFSVEDGEELWTADRGGGSNMLQRRDVFVARGGVWYGDGRYTVAARDLATGEKAARIKPEKILSLGHHPRCYRSKATVKYVLPPFRGVEFIGIDGDRHAQSDWVRGSCAYGIMPANGLVYAPQHPCFCYPGVKLKGLNALAPEPGGVEVEPSGSEQLTEGPAYGQAAQLADVEFAAGAWPMYRHDPARHGSVPCEVPADPQKRWSAELGGDLTPPVVAGGRLFVGAKDRCTVYALDADEGNVLWRYRTAGRIDSPPTVHGGLLLFGSADGHVHCLRASNGTLAWRFRAAPSERRIMASSRLESAWPVHGSILVRDGLACCAAGRSTYLDGGIYVYALDVATGEVAHSKRLDTWSRTRPDAQNTHFIPAHHMEGSLSQLLVSEGDYLYLGQYKLNMQLEQQEVPYVEPGEVSPEGIPVKGRPYSAENRSDRSYERDQHDWLLNTWPELTEQYRERYGGWNLGRRTMGTHLMAPWGFLDASWFNRSFWMYGDIWPGFYLAHRAARTGQLVVVGPEQTYSMKAYTSRNMQSPLPARKGYLVQADSNETKPRLRPETQGTPKGYGFTRTQEPEWFRWVPLRVRGMVLAGDRLFMAGPPGVPEVDDPFASIRGQKGGILASASAEDGARQARRRLEAPPVHDGLIAAGGRLYMSTKAGEVICLGD